MMLSGTKGTLIDMLPARQGTQWQRMSRSTLKRSFEASKPYKLAGVIALLCFKSIDSFLAINDIIASYVCVMHLKQCHLPGIGIFMPLATHGDGLRFKHSL